MKYLFSIVITGAVAGGIYYAPMELSRLIFDYARITGERVFWGELTFMWLGVILALTLVFVLARQVKL